MRKYLSLGTALFAGLVAAKNKPYEFMKESSKDSNSLASN